jgi:hypothetical protein
MNDLEHGSSAAISRKLPTPMASDGMKDGAGGGAGSTYPFRQILGTPTSNPAPRGSVLRREKGRMHTEQDDFDRTPNMGEVVHFLLPTPRASDASHGPEVTKARTAGSTGVSLVTTMHMAQETLPTPTKRDKRMDAWSPAYDRRKSPTMDAVLDGAMTDRSPDKWAYARQIAALLSDTGLTGPSQTLPITYGWMMGYPPGWLATALISAMAKGSLRPASSSRRSATPSSPKSRKPSAEPS